jgi:CcmD family protein
VLTGVGVMLAGAWTSGPLGAAGAQQSGFVPIDQLPPQQTMSASPLLLGAYAIVWLALIAFVWSMWRRLGKVEQELADARREIGARKTGGRP